ncbi:MAG: hypothetical protein DLM55_12470 [Acidimicrobiales bacterium]|nr:MAG: hypothetical protein DLM55_12470 [Acidimicrobiales bacterium]
MLSLLALTPAELGEVDIRDGETLWQIERVGTASTGSTAAAELLGEAPTSRLVVSSGVKPVGVVVLCSQAAPARGLGLVAPPQNPA